jgi:hypothetical protein
MVYLIRSIDTLYSVYTSQGLAERLQPLREEAALGGADLGAKMPLLDSYLDETLTYMKERQVKLLQVRLELHKSPKYVFLS